MKTTPAKLWGLVLLGLLGASLGLSLSQLAAQAEPARLPNDKLQLFQERSIFSRERLRYGRGGFGYRETRQQEVRTPPPVLTGVLFDQNEWFAFLEDPQTAMVTAVRVGQVLPQGRIESIAIDSLLVRSVDGTGEPRKIEIGQTLTGGPRPVAAAPDAPADAPAPTAPAATTGPAPQAGPAVVVDMSDPVERMKARRRAELAK